jgi:L-2-amino-thiazoline-4-carboxylic acid hydrolase
MSAARCAAQAPAPTSETHDWTEKADMSWEDIFKFAFQRTFIPTMKDAAAHIGEDKLIPILQEAGSERARKGMEGNRIPKRDLATWAGHMKAAPPLFRHALTVEIVEDGPQVFELRISRCLWAKTFREADAAAIGYATICHPDFAVASGFNPKLKLIRTKTLMQGHDCCNHRYVMEA